MSNLWLAAEDPYTRTVFAPGSSVDFLDTFNSSSLNSPDQKWGTVETNLGIFKFYQAFIDNGTNAELKNAFLWCVQHHISIGLEAGLLPTLAPGSPGWGVEGYNGMIYYEVQRIHDLGGNLRYLAMDEPLFFGHQWDGQNAAHDSVQNIAGQVATVYSKLTKIFPELQLGDVEPIPLVSPSDEAAFADAIKTATGKELAFFQADILWDYHENWQAPLQQIVEGLTNRGTSTGIIINGNGNADYTGMTSSQADLAWTHDAVSHLIQVENNSAFAHSDLIFQTWMKYPTHVLSEGQPGTLTNVMLDALYLPQILPLYQGVLSRIPTGNEVSVSTLQLYGGTSAAALRTTLAGSAEAASLITSTFQQAFGVAPSAANLAALTTALAGPTDMQFIASNVRFATKLFDASTVPHSHNWRGTAAATPSDPDATGTFPTTPSTLLTSAGVIPISAQTIGQPLSGSFVIMDDTDSEIASSLGGYNILAVTNSDTVGNISDFLATDISTDVLRVPSPANLHVFGNSFATTATRVASYSGDAATALLHMSSGEPNNAESHFWA